VSFYVPFALGCASVGFTMTMLASGHITAAMVGTVAGVLSLCRCAIVAERGW
jgi:hypothetical protein